MLLYFVNNKKMKKSLILIPFLLIYSACLFSQNKSLDSLRENLDYIPLPFKIQDFNDFKVASDQRNISLFNKITMPEVGYLNHKSEMKKATGSFEKYFLERKHEKMVDKEKTKYIKQDSIKISFIGLLDLNPKYTIILTKIKDVPNNMQSAFRYKLLSFAKSGEHLSTIDVFELIDDTATKEWLKGEPLPFITSEFLDNGKLKIRWDEGYDQVFIQDVRLNTNGIFEVENLIEIER